MQRALRLDEECRLWSGTVGGTDWEMLGLVDCVNSDFALSQDASAESADLPGLQGEFLNGYKFAARGMSIVLITDAELSAAEKKAVAAKIRILYRYSMASDLFFMDDYHFEGQRGRYCRMSGGMDDPKQNPGWFSQTLPLKCFDPLWYGVEKKTVTASGNVTVGGNNTMWPVFKAEAGSVNPAGGVGGFSFRYAGTVPKGTVLYVDTKRMDGYLLGGDGGHTEVPMTWNMAGFYGVEPGRVAVSLSGGAVMEYMECFV